MSEYGGITQHLFPEVEAEERLERLVTLAIRSAGLGSVLRGTRRMHVGRAFMVGATTAASLCRAAGVDPFENVGGCVHCAERELGEHEDERAEHNAWPEEEGW